MNRPTLRTIFLFWVPLAATWVMMSLEGPFLAAVIARLADPKVSLAAHGVAFAFAILVESPVIMLMSAATALVENSQNYRALRNFMIGLNVLATGLLVAVLIPAVYDLMMRTALGLPDEVADLTYGALVLLLPWPATIGYRRFLHGLMIRSGKTRLVAVGTVLRLMGMAGVALGLFFFADLPGAWVGAAALSAGVSVEALATHFMARPTVRAIKATPLGSVSGGIGEPGEAGGVSDGSGNGRDAGVARETTEDTPSGPLSYGEIAHFYLPLALTSFIGLSVQPLLTFFMGRAPMPLESLAVFPVVMSLSFLFRSLGLSFQEAAIALLGRRGENRAVVGRFALILGLASSLGLGAVAFTPLSTVWFETISGLTPELAAFAILPTMILVPLPAMSVLLSYQRAMVVLGRRTHAITVATVTEIVIVGIAFSVAIASFNVVGVTAAFAAFLFGRLGGNVYLIRPVRQVVRSVTAAGVGQSRGA